MGNNMFFRMHRISDIYFVGGFGTVQWVDVAEYAATTPDSVVLDNPHKTLQVCFVPRFLRACDVSKAKMQLSHAMPSGALQAYDIAKFLHICTPAFALNFRMRNFSELASLRESEKSFSNFAFIE